MSTPTAPPPSPKKKSGTKRAAVVDGELPAKTKGKWQQANDLEKEAKQAFISYMDATARAYRLRAESRLESDDGAAHIDEHYASEFLARSSLARSATRIAMGEESDYMASFNNLSQIERVARILPDGMEFHFDYQPSGSEQMTVDEQTIRQKMKDIGVDWLAIDPEYRSDYDSKIDAERDTIPESYFVQGRLAKPSL